MRLCTRYILLGYIYTRVYRQMKDNIHNCGCTIVSVLYQFAQQGQQCVQFGYAMQVAMYAHKVAR